jgi:poly(hydroxyalkanoate) depolymerase family esterase
MTDGNTMSGDAYAARNRPRAATRVAGRFIDDSYENRVGRRDYKLYIPTGYSGKGPVPLIVILHGCVQTPEDLARGTRMNTYAEEKTFLVAYPKQSLEANRLSCWSWFSPEDQQRERGEPSIIAGLTRHIMSQFAVDPDRLYVAGISAGGAMAAILGATYPDLYAAVGVHSGVEYAAAHNLPSALKATRFGGPDPRRKLYWPDPLPGVPRRFVPLILFHGDKDHMANRINAEQLAMQWALAHSGAGKGAANGPGLHAKAIDGQVPGGRAFRKTLYCDHLGREVMEKWIIHQAGHAWAGGDSEVMFMDPLGPNASAEMVRFFLEHPRQ